MTTENTGTKIESVFVLSCYEVSHHRTTGYADGGMISFSQSVSPLHAMIESFRYRPLGTHIKVTMEEVD